MDIYILNERYQKLTVIDSFESLVWTNRYSACGDFEMKIAETNSFLELLQIGRFLGMEGSERIMKIERREFNTDTDNPGVVTISGRSLELNMFKRLTSGFATAGNATFTGMSHQVILDMVRLSCVEDILGDPLPNGWTGSYKMFIHTSLTTSRNIDKTYQLDYLYNTVKAIADLAGLGFKWTVPGSANPGMALNEQFEVYSGIERTTQSNSGSIVSFRPDMENLTKIAYLESTESFKTGAMVYGDQWKRSLWVPATWRPEGLLRGPDESILLVDANDIEVPTSPTEFDKLLRARGLENLANHNFTKVIDGEVDADESYVFERDYFFGDIVEVSDGRDVIGRSRVSEYTYIFDSDGVREFPSFTVIS